MMATSYILTLVPSFIKNPVGAAMGFIPNFWKTAIARGICVALVTSMNLFLVPKRFL